MQWLHTQAEWARRIRNSEELCQHHQRQINTEFAPYLFIFCWLSEVIKRYSKPFDFNPGLNSWIFFSHILTLDRLSRDTNTNTVSTPARQLVDTGTQTSDVEFVSSISLTTYINIRKCLDDLQHQQRLENQRDIGTSTEINTVTVGTNTHNSFSFDISVWLNSPYQTIAEIYKEELVDLKDFELDSNYITAHEPTTELPPANDTLLPPPPWCHKCKWQENEEMPRWSLRLKTSLQYKQNWGVGCCAEGSCPGISWRLFTAASR